MNKSLLVSEVKYFIQLSLKDKINILNTFKQVQNINNSNVPYLFKALQSNMNINTKAEFINKINTHSIHPGEVKMLNLNLGWNLY